MKPGTTALARALPFKVRERLTNYLDFVHDTATNVALERAALDRLRSHQELIETIFVVRFLWNEFLIPFQNYTEMLDYLSSLNVSGIRIGGQIYNQHSELELDWRNLADALGRLVHDAQIERWIRPSVPLAQVIEEVLSLRGENAPDE